MNLLELSKDMLDGAALWVDVDLPFAAAVHDGHPRVLVVVGENCSGKSYFVETLRVWGSGAEEKIINIQVSIRERTGAGASYDGGMRRQMMFGDESEHSTGTTSVGVIERAFDNMKSRDESGYKCMLVLDEPELGLSDGYARAMGTWLAQLAQALPASSPGVAIVTHSRALVEALAKELGQPPSFVSMGHGMDYPTWLASAETKSVEDLLKLRDTDRAGWLAVRAALDAVRKQAAEREAKDNKTKPRATRSRRTSAS